MLTRRGVLQTAATVCASAVLRPAGRALAEADASLVLRLLPGKPLPIPHGFAGLGYELSSAARPGLIDAANAGYAQLVRSLGPAGVVRFGGIVADFTSYQPYGQPAWDPKGTVLTRASLQRVRGFLDAVGWSAIWSLNFGRGSLDDAVAEARDVARILGPRLLAIELGNEVENYSHGTAPLRPPPYDYEAYRTEYDHWRKTVLQAVPGLRFAAPDTAASVAWVERMAADAQGAVQLLTTHYYRGGQRQGTPEQLMHADPELQANLQRLRRATDGSGLPWRMCETNSFYGGGRPGVSDTLLGALWTLDFMLLLLANGCSGVNIETGVNQLGFLSSYSPIRDDPTNKASVGAPYYGMLAFAEAVKNATTILPTAFEAHGVDVTAYALGADDRLRSVAVVNKTADRAVRVSLPAGFARHAKVLRLRGASLLDAKGVELGGAAVGVDGTWTGAKRQSLATDSIRLEPSSAAIVS